MFSWEWLKEHCGDTELLNCPRDLDKGVGNTIQLYSEI